MNPSAHSGFYMVSLMHHDLSDLGLICLAKKC